MLLLSQLTVGGSLSRLPPLLLLSLHALLLLLLDTLSHKWRATRHQVAPHWAAGRV